MATLRTDRALNKSVRDLVYEDHPHAVHMPDGSFVMDTLSEFGRQTIANGRNLGTAPESRLILVALEMADRMLNGGADEFLECLLLASALEAGISRDRFGKLMEEVRDYIDENQGWAHNIRSRRTVPPGLQPLLRGKERTQANQAGIMAMVADSWGDD